MMKKFARAALVILTVILMSPVLLHARACSVSGDPCTLTADCPAGQTCEAVMKDYCITPPFITAGVKPNILLMIDNSSSMYDLAYSDQGQKSGATITRQPFYCYDQTYKNNVCSGNSSRTCSADSSCNYCSGDTSSVCSSDADCGGGTCVTTQVCNNLYTGYFNSTDYYDYNLTDLYFTKVATFPASTDCDYFLANRLCVKIDGSTSPNTLSRFAASGNYLNWLTSSKFDVEKKVLTGGKYVPKVCKDNQAKPCSVNADCGTAACGTLNGLQAESRGCLGQGFVKEALTADFVNFADGATDPNTQLGVAFSVRGPFDSANPSAPSRGGQTFIEVYRGNYNAGNCEAAIKTWSSTTASQTDVRNAVELCLNYNDSNTQPNYCSGNISLACTIDANCVFPGNPAVSGGCSNNASILCTSDLVCGSRTEPGTCDNVARSCLANGDCTVFSAATCSNAGTKTGNACTGPADCVVPEVRGTCSNMTTKSCSEPNVNSDCYKAEQMGTCTTGINRSCRTATQAVDCKAIQGHCSKIHGNAYDTCTTDADCGTASDPTKYGTCSNPVNVAAGTCSNYFAASTGTCDNYTAPVTGSCDGTATTGNCAGVTTVANTCNNPAPIPSTTLNYGPCINPSQSTVTKTKIAYSHTIQTCWSYFNAKANHPTWTSAQLFANGDYQRLTTKCDEVYVGWGICSLDNSKVCAIDTDCSGSGLGTCQHGPSAIRPGNPALVCSQSYIGQFCNGFTWNDAATPPSGRCTSWAAESVTTDDVFAQFCEAQQPTVIDPTDSATSNPNYEQTPAIISGTGLEAQLGSPIGTIPVKLALTSQPRGLIQEYAGQIRTGAMSFDQFGSATEASATSVIKVPKVCSNDTSRLCQIPADCGGASCDYAGAADNLDGGRILYPVGYGKCANMTSTSCTADATCIAAGHGGCFNGFCGTETATVCTTNENCTAGSQICATRKAGDHVTAGSLVKAIDDIRANAWTPFAEAFYNIIGYFAKIPTGLTNAGKSRADLRINSINDTSTDFSSEAVAPKDFNANLNPSEYRCQQNYVLLISDGASTADQHASVSSLASNYATGAGLTAGTCSNYLGSKNLPIMTWLAKNRNIGTLSKTDPTASTTPTNPRDYVTTYVVYNGGDNGQTGDCDSYTLLNNAATKGGTTLKTAENPSALNRALREVFSDVAAKAASGTAASILSNSEGSGANILQAVFYPKKVFENETSANWIGEMQNLWYFVDPLIASSTIREDTDYSGTGDHTLNLVGDYIVRFAFDPTSDRTMVQRYQDINGDGTADNTIGGLIDPDDVKSIWRAGKLLWSRNITSTPRNIKTTVNGTSLIDFSSATFPGHDADGNVVSSNAVTLAPYLNVPEADAPTLINWVHGQDQGTTYRERVVDIKNPPPSTTSSSGTWRMGDIISSTPRVQSTVRLNTYNLPTPGGYNDKSYQSFVGSNNYKRRGMVYVGANDGMMHAFKLGILSVEASGARKATLSGTGLGEEKWAFIPKNALPYLKFAADPAYSHLYYIDGRTVIFDASIGDTNSGECVASTYWKCEKSVSGSVVNGSNELDATKNTWRSIVIGGMGIGGASTISTCATGSKCVQTPRTDPEDTSKGLGYSSYFALDVTDPDSPQLLWEFSNPDLGYSTSGPAVIRIGDPTKNGRWFAIFGSGPTGPIDTDTHQFQASSSQPLKYFVVDMRSGALVKTITTGISDAFSGTLLGASIDADRWNSSVVGFYQDDGLYTGYVKADGGGALIDGGVGRIFIDQLDPAVEPTDTNVANIWHWSTIADGIGPVTTAISRLQDRKNRNLWLFFGTGRYYFRAGAVLDDYTSPRTLFGIKEPCYNRGNIGNYLDHTCSDPLPVSVLHPIVNQTDSISTIAAEDPGWKINLDASSTTEAAERVVTDTVALTNGTVFFTSFKPTTDICGYGGNSFLWGVKYDTGGQPAANSMQGKALIQLSTGEFREVDLSTAFTDKLNRRMLSPMTGKPPSDAPPVISNSTNKPIKRILHLKEH